MVAFEFSDLADKLNYDGGFSVFKKILLVAIMFALPSSLMAEGTGEQGKYFQISKQTTIWTAHEYIRRIVVASRGINCGGGLLCAKVGSYGWTKCKAGFSQYWFVEQRKLTEVSDFRYGSIVSVDSYGDQGVPTKIELSGKFRVMVTSGGSDSEVKVKQVLTIHGHNLYDVAKAMEFIAKECGGGSIFRQ